jgi:hypothetical protein
VGDRTRAAWLVGGAIAVIVAAVAVAVPVDEDARTRWRMVHRESFRETLHVDQVAWVKDPQGPASPWHVDQFDDDGEAWARLSGPAFSRALSTFAVYRKRVTFGADGWLTAEIAAQDKDLDGRPDSEPGLRRVPLGGGAAEIHEPSWDAGVVIRPTRPLPATYRVEVTLRDVDFGGRREGRLRYDGKYNGYRLRDCVTAYPWTFRGAEPGKDRCEMGDVKNQNGFYYLGILDYATPAPHGNPSIHNRRKVVIDGYNSVAPWSKVYGICNPRTGEITSVDEGNLTALNAVFVRGDTFRKANNNVSNEYFFKTECGNHSGDSTWGEHGQFRDLLSAAELQPESLPQKSYRFAIERQETGYTIEMSGPFRHSGQKTLRYEHDFVEDGRPIWHYNRTAQEYDGRFDTALRHTGPNGSVMTPHTWPAGSAYPDSFIIGDPHLNYYEGTAVVDDITLLVPE